MERRQLWLLSHKEAYCFILVSSLHMIKYSQLITSLIFTLKGVFRKRKQRLELGNYIFSFQDVYYSFQFLCLLLRSLNFDKFKVCLIGVPIGHWYGMYRFISTYCMSIWQHVPMARKMIQKFLKNRKRQIRIFKLKININLV